MPQYAELSWENTAWFPHGAALALLAPSPAPQPAASLGKRRGEGRSHVLFWQTWTDAAHGALSLSQQSSSHAVGQAAPSHLNEELFGHCATLRSARLSSDHIWYVWYGMVPQNSNCKSLSPPTLFLLQRRM